MTSKNVGDVLFFFFGGGGGGEQLGYSLKIIIIQQSTITNI